MFYFKRHYFYLFIAVISLTALSLLPAANFVQANEATSPILVIDPGHGGEDGGAVATNGTLESSLNLQIALKLDALSAFWGVDTVMTRQQSEIDYPEGAETLSAKKKADQNARLSLINSTPGAILFSIHQNYYPSESPWGIQVFYGSITGSDTLATVTQANLTGQLCPDNRRLAAPMDDSIYLIKNASCPSILIECGFLSNPGEREALETHSYQLELASVMLASYLQYIRGTSS